MEDDVQLVQKKTKKRHHKKHRGSRVQLTKEDKALTAAEKETIARKKDEAKRKGISVKELMATEKYEAELGELKDARKDVIELEGKLKAASRDAELAVKGGSSKREAAAKFNIDDLNDTLNPARKALKDALADIDTCLLYTSPSPRDRTRSRMPSSA